MTSAEQVELGGNIRLTGFSDLVPGSMTILKKIVGTYTKRYGELRENFETVELRMKPIHKTTEKAKQFHVNAKLVAAGEVVSTEAESHNLFMAVDSSLKKVEAQISK